MTDTYWPWDMEMGKPHSYTPLYQVDLEEFLRALNEATGSQDFDIESMPYWGA